MFHFNKSSCACLMGYQDPNKHKTSFFSFGHAPQKLKTMHNVVLEAYPNIYFGLKQLLDTPIWVQCFLMSAIRESVKLFRSWLSLSYLSEWIMMRNFTLIIKLSSFHKQKGTENIFMTRNIFIHGQRLCFYNFYSQLAIALSLLSKYISEWHILRTN